MASPERPTQFQEQDSLLNNQAKLAQGKSFENLQNFVIHGTVKPIRIYPEGTNPNYSDRTIYYPLPKSRIIFQNRERDLMVVAAYLFEDKTLEEIGQENGNLTREAVRKIIKGRVRDLHTGAEEWARDRFPLESFDFRKPLTIASRQKNSKIHGGTSLEIARRIEQGARLEEIKREFGTTKTVRSRPVLKNWNIELEIERNPILPQFEGLTNLDATDQEIQVLLDKVRYNGQYTVLKQAGLVVNLATVAEKAGLYVGGDQIIFISESLAKELLPQTKVAHKIKDKNGQEKTFYYHIIAAIDEENAIDILRADHNLDDLRINPVRQIAGLTQEKLPNTYESQSGEYASFGNLIRAITGSVWRGRKGQIKTADLIKGSPVSIYSRVNKKGIFYRREQEEELRKHLESRLSELGLL